MIAALRILGNSTLVTFTYFLQSPPPSTVETIHEREKITFPYDMVTDEAF